MKILIIEDNDILRGNIKKYLQIQSYDVHDHASYTWAAYKIINGNYDVIILDLWLGSNEGDGVDICRFVRESGCSVPIIMLTARTLTEQKVEGLNSGSDDYMVKPFEYIELLSRIKSVIRRDYMRKWNKILIGAIEILEDSREVHNGKISIELSKLEFRLLLFLAQNQGKVMSKDIIMERVWGEIDVFEESRNVDIYVWYLRKKLGKTLIETVRGTGYMIP